MLITYWFALANAHLHWNSRGHHRTSCSRSLSAQLVVGAASRFATETGEKAFSLKCRIGSWMLILSSCGGFAQLGSWAPSLHLSHCHSSKERRRKYNRRGSGVEIRTREITQQLLGWAKQTQFLCPPRAVVLRHPYSDGPSASAVPFQ